jgi:hypothetical protein
MPHGSTRSQVTFRQEGIWLYVRGVESIRVTKLPLASMLFINGPGHVHVPSERRSRYERHIGAERRRR